MSIGFIFWLLMLLWLAFGLYTRYPRPGTPSAPWIWGGDALLYVLMFLLGWKVFGWPIAG